jgi:N-acetyl-gamma-glutamyl-phosphate reductase
MIHASIVGAETEVAGELLRILLYHPDVELTCVYSPSMAGKAIDEVHHGMIGDTDLIFSSTIDLSKTNMVFVCAPQADNFLAELDAEARVVDLTDTHVDGSDDFVYGFCELNRKPLVRGALRAGVPTAIAQPILMALLPLANSLLLNEDITIKTNAEVTAEALNEVETLAKSLQLSFNKKIMVQPTQFAASPRAMFVEVSFDCAVETAQIVELLNNFYDDHNFTFVIGREPKADDVANTNKCIMYVRREDAKIVITAAIDPQIKGSAGTAVHCMNLLFGLHERVGLTLKASL